MKTAFGLLFAIGILWHTAHGYINPGVAHIIDTYRANGVQVDTGWTPPTTPLDAFREAFREVVSAN